MATSVALEDKVCRVIARFLYRTPEWWPMNIARYPSHLEFQILARLSQAEQGCGKVLCQIVMKTKEVLVMPQEASLASVPICIDLSRKRRLELSSFSDVLCAVMSNEQRPCPHTQWA